MLKNNTTFWGVVGGGYFLLIYIVMLTGLDIFRHISVFSAAVLGVWSVFSCKKSIGPLLASFLITGISCIFSSIRGFGDNTNIYEFFYVLMGIVFCTRKMNIKVLSIFFYLISVLIFVRYMQNFYYFFFAPKDDKISFFAFSSSNYISVFLLSMIGVVFYQAIIQREKLPIIPVIFCVILSVLSQSRMGMLMSLLFLVFVYFERGTKKISIKKVFLLAITLVVSFGVLYYILSHIFNLIGIDGLDFITDKFENRSKNYSEDERSIILSDYMKNINFKTFILGVDVPRYVYDSPHNSFLNLHYHFGILTFVILYYICKSLAFFWKYERALFYTFLLLLMRAFTDDMFFVNIFDIVAVLFIMAPYVIPGFFVKNKKI